MGLVVFSHLGLAEAGARLFAGRGLPWVGGLFAIDFGDLGVSVFFVISGFLITTLLIRGADGRGSLPEFYLRRFFRIFPPYYVYLGVVGVLWVWHRVPMLAGALVSAASYTSNYWPYWRSEPAGAGWLVGHTWSLSLEEQFYLFWPACLYWLGRRRAAWVGVGLMVAAPVSRVLTLHFFPGAAFDGQINRMFHTRIDTIMAGCVLALLGAWPGVWRRVVVAAGRGWVGVVAVGLLYADLRGSEGSWRYQEVAGLSFEAVLLGFLVLFCVTQAESAFGRALNWGWLRHVGVISYSLYLWQQMFDGPVNVLPGRHHQRWIPLMILGAAEISYWVVERGSFRVRDWVLRGRVTGAGA